jgi:O-antigen/teichoic acid export membrane protein
MIIALVGLLREKIDLYLMALVGTTEELGMYHVLISALNIMKTGAAFLVQPFIKNIYRLPLKALRMITRRMVLAGVIITVLGTLALAVIIPNVFGFYFSWKIYLLGAAAVFPFYYSINFTHRLYRRHQERRMIFFAVSGILLNAVLSIALIPAYGVMGALVGTAAAEWLVLIILSIHERRREA